MSIRDSPPEERPRERLRRVGARALANRELLGILVGSGGPGGSALHVADRVLSAVGGSLRRLASSDPAHVERVSGVGRATGARLLAALEIGRRAAAELGPDRWHLRGPGDVYRLLGPRLRDLRQEEFHALLVNAQNRLLREVLVTRGTLDASLVHPREVFRTAVAESAAGILLVHNHPSGDPSPSSEDRAVTRQMAEAGRALGIPVLDHVIVGDGRWVSLAEAGGCGLP